MIESAAQWITAAVIAFVWIGIQEAIVKPIAKKITKQKIIKYAPTAMRFLDEQMPRMIVQSSGKAIEDLLIERLESVTGETWKKAEIDELFLIYDPRITADKHPS